MDEYLLHAFEDAFDPGSWPGIVDGVYLRSPEGARGQWIAYWGWCLARARELMGDSVRPGTDYALTEVVHCGSTSERGVWSAAATCVPLYLNRVLEQSPALVVIVVGSVAKRMLVKYHPSVEPRSGRHVGPITLGSRDRHILFLPHPNARGKKSIGGNLGSPEILAQLRDLFLPGEGG
jgi:hypothetical protein